MDGRFLLFLDSEDARDALIESIADSVNGLTTPSQLAIRDIAVIEPAPEPTLSLLVHDRRGGEISARDVKTLLAIHAPNADLARVRVVAQ